MVFFSFRAFLSIPILSMGRVPGFLFVVKGCALGVVLVISYFLYRRKNLGKGGTESEGEAGL